MWDCILGVILMIYSAYPLCLLDVCFAATSHLEMGFLLPQTLVTAGNFVTTDHLGLRWKRLASGLMTTINLLAYWLWAELLCSAGQWWPDQVRVSPTFVFEFKTCCMLWRLGDKRIWPLQRVEMYVVQQQKWLEMRLERASGFICQKVCKPS